ncbi:MAG: response regulator, partial [Lachnospiraceae bacterium]
MVNENNKYTGLEGVSMNIMLVDDDRYVLEGLKKLLNWNAFCGRLTATASNGAEALELFISCRPDVIITDIKMPVMDGISLACHVHEQSPDITIILLSSYGEFEYAQKAIQYKVASYILKPITKEKVNELQLLLEDLYHRRTHQKEEFLSNWKPNFEETIMAALRNQDIKMFDDFFASCHFHEKLDRDTSNAYGIQLINFLYLYLSDL